VGPDLGADRAAAVVTLVAGVVLFGGLAIASLGYTASGFGGGAAAPSGSDSAGRRRPAGQALPDAVRVADERAVPVARHGVGRSRRCSPTLSRSWPRRASSPRSPGPLNPNGATLTAALYVQLHDQLGPAGALPPVPPASVRVSPAQYQAYRATGQYVSADGHTVQYLVGLTAGDPAGTPALNATPAIRAAVTSVAGAIGASDSGVAGQAPALYDISFDLRQRPRHGDPDRHHWSSACCWHW